MLSGQIIFSNHDATEVGPRMHLKKIKGHASDELINMNNCPAPGEALENCEDTVRIEFSTDVTDKTFDQFIITDNDGTQYVFEPTKKYTTVFLDDYVKRSRKRLSPGPFCDYYTSPEKWSTVKLLQSFAYEFGITEILGPDYVDDSVPGISSGDSGNWIKFSYRHWNGLYEKGTPHDGGCMEGPDGSQTMTRENNDLNYVDKIETPTHFAKFNYEYDFGTTTELLLVCISSKTGDNGIRVIARNNLPAFSCEKCGKTAKNVCSTCIWNFKGFVCTACSKKHKCGEEYLLPIVNSPRVGMCGFTGDACKLLNS